MARSLIICLLLLLIFAGCKKDTTAAGQAKEQALIDDKLIQEYITANNLTATKVVRGTLDTTGVWFVKTTIGTTSALVTTSSLVTVGYTARLMGSNTVFAQTSEFHPAFRLGEMIKGWQYYYLYKNAAVKKGEKVRLLIASRYAYGPYEQPTYKLPANAILDFEIELFDVTN